MQFLDDDDNSDGINYVSKYATRIFLTVGNIDPFDRLVQAFDEWILTNPSFCKTEIVAQIGYGRYLPKNCPYVRFMPPLDYRETFERAQFVVAHAGMGTIITAVELRKPLIVMPKRATLGEQRNEHQLATVREFRKLPILQVADSETELPELLNTAISEIEMRNSILSDKSMETDFQPSSTLINFITEFVNQR